MLKLSQWLWTTLLACCLNIALAEELPSIGVAPKSDILDDNLQINGLQKRDWNKDLKMWGKRGWSNLRGGWGIKRSPPAYDDEMYYNLPPIAEKRAWQKLQGGWGKRYAPDDGENDFHLPINQLPSMLERDQQMEQLYSQFPGNDNDNIDITEEEKRNWNQFNGGWGKRSKWDKFRGAWGKRDPAWSNLKGIWGKRSVSNDISK